MLVKSNGINKLIVVVNKMDDRKSLDPLVWLRHGQAERSGFAATVKWEEAR